MPKVLFTKISGRKPIYIYQSTLAYSVEISYSAYKLRANIKFLACGAVLLVSKQLFLFTDSHNIYFLKRSMYLTGKAA